MGNPFRTYDTSFDSWVVLDSHSAALGAGGLVVWTRFCRPPLPDPLSPALGERFTGPKDPGTGERGQLGCSFYPGRRAQALALG
jgi:hypothetical protein